MEHFKIKIDTSACVSLVADHDVKLNDTWHYRDLTFESGKIYALVSERGQGCEYLSYLLGGRIPFENVKVLYNDKIITQNDLKNMSWNLEPSDESYGKKVVRKQIEKALKKNRSDIGFKNIAERFLLTPERVDRKFVQLSGERWRAASALGFALNRRIFFAPYMSSYFYYQMCSPLLKALNELKNSGALVVLPVGSDAVVKCFADEVIYLDPIFDLERFERDLSNMYN